MYHLDNTVCRFTIILCNLWCCHRHHQWTGLFYYLFNRRNCWCLIPIIYLYGHIPLLYRHQLLIHVGNTRTVNIIFITCGPLCSAHWKCFEFIFVDCQMFRHIWVLYIAWIRIHSQEHLVGRYFVRVSVCVRWAVCSCVCVHEAKQRF